MASPLYSPEPKRNYRANWLERFLGVERKTDAKVIAVLEQAAIDAEKALSKVGGDDLPANTKRLQYNLALKSIRRTIAELFYDVEDIIRDSSKDAAVAAVEAGISDDAKALKALFPDAAERSDYLDSLKQTAERNVQATITRILVTEQPLSSRVYQTRALSNGLVTRTINNGLARGDSAATIASNVSRSIRPNTKGGVSFAAQRVARTEINNAYHAQSIMQNQEKPWVDHIEWKLSKSHKKSGCVCEAYAAQGKFSKESVPPKPHPQCYCYVVPVTVDDAIFFANLKAGLYNQYLDTMPTATAL